jgi:hypothetical protein
MKDLKFCLVKTEVFRPLQVPGRPSMKSMKLHHAEHPLYMFLSWWNVDENVKETSILLDWSW